MKTIDFLRLVWPSSGHYLLAIPIKYTDRNTGQEVQSYKHFAFTDIAAAAEHATALANDRDAPHNVFFAMASVKEDWTRARKEQREAAGRKVRGIHKSGFDNTQAVRCFWFDLDVDVDKAGRGLAYATRDDAAVGIRGFCAAMGLPKPFITSSGGGFHVYWPLTDEIDGDKWQHYANILKQLAAAWGLRADPSRTADRASVLRPVGTHNWKTGAPRTVQVVVNGVVSDTNQFLSKLAYLAETADLPPVPTKGPAVAAPTIAGVAPNFGQSAVQINDAAAAGAGYEQPDPREVVMACQQLAWQAAHQDQVDQPQWYAMVGAIRHCKRGTEAVYRMSAWRMQRQVDPYSQSDIDEKIAQLTNGGFGPSLCSTFEQHRPGGCDGCPHKGKIKTPLQTVRKLQQVAPPTVQLMQAGGVAQVALPPPPKPFKRVTNPLTGNARIAMTIGDAKTGQQEDVVIYEYDLYPSKLIFDEREARYVVVVNRWLPKDGWAEFEVPTGRLYDRKNLAVTFGDIGVMPDLGHVEELVQYMIGYIRDLQKAAQSNTIYAQLGWREGFDEFVMPDKIVKAGAVEPITPSRNILTSLNYKKPMGDLDTWKKMAAVYERPGMEAHQFGFGVGFASPLFAFTNFNGMVVSMVGKRGAGKSSSAMMANSIWGHPMMGWTDREHDTIKAFYQKLGILKNLPATYDEHTNLPGEVISELCYTVSKGQGRQRLKANGEAMENFGNFQLMMLMTGNTSLNSRLAIAKADSSAEAARVFEYVVPQDTMTKTEADLYWGPGGQILTNYGLAGEVYAQQLIGSKQWTMDRVRHWVQVVDQQAGVSSGERFWSAGVACVLTGFELANQCGLTNCDIDRLLQFAVRVIHSMRMDVTDNTRGPISVVSDYFNSNLRSALILATDGHGTTAPQMLNVPTDKLRIRYERFNGRLYIDRADFGRFCGKQGIDRSALARELQLMGVLKSLDTKITLGKGTPVSGMQTICWVLDMNHPDVKGVGELMGVATTPAVGGQQACV